MMNLDTELFTFTLGLLSFTALASILITLYGFGTFPGPEPQLTKGSTDTGPGSVGGALTH